EPTPRNRRLLSTALRVGRELGLELEDAGLVGGASDANTTSLYTATLDGLGPAGGSDHAPDEHMSIESTVERAALLAREERVALVGRHRRDERRRRDAVAEVGGREPLLEREPPLLGRAEERARRERRPPRSLPLRDDGAAQRGEELLHPALHRVAEVAHVPEEREATVGPQHAVELRQRTLVVEPVERLRDRHDVDARVRERQLLRRPVERLDALELRPHLRNRLDREHARARTGQEPRQLPRAGSDVGDRPPRPERRPL